MTDNAISLIIRSHEPLPEGVENMGSVINLFSATDYCGVTNNKAAILLIRKDGTISWRAAKSSLP